MKAAYTGRKLPDSLDALKAHLDSKIHDGFNIVRLARLNFENLIARIETEETNEQEIFHCTHWIYFQIDLFFKHKSPFKSVELYFQSSTDEICSTHRPIAPGVGLERFEMNTPENRHKDVS